MKTKNTLLTGLGLHPSAMSSTISMCAKQIFDGGFPSIAGEYLVQAVQLIILLLIWKSLSGDSGAPGGMELNQLMTYTLMATVLHPQLNIVSSATSALWEGSIIGRFLRPVPVEISFITETIGRKWIPSFFLFGLPVWLIAPLFGIHTGPASAVMGIYTLFSLILTASLGFAIDLLFAAFAMNLKNGCFIALNIRNAIYALLSGEMIPFALFPWDLGSIFSLLPFGSIAHAPLTLYTGGAEQPLLIIGLQIFWNITLWALAIIVFSKSKERMVSFGG